MIRLPIFSHGRLLLLACLAVVQMSAAAQFTYFAYVQTEDTKPFSLTLNKKIYNSSPVGHIILPALPNGNHDIQVSIPGENSRLEFRISIQDADGGFVIKKYDSQYGLLNLLTTQIQMSGAIRQAEQQAAAETARLEKEKAEQEANEAANRLAAEKAAAEKAETARLELEEAARKAEEQKAEALRQEQAAEAKKAAEATMTEAEKQAAAAQALRERQEAEVRAYNEARRKQLEAEATAQKAAAPQTAPPTDRPLTPAEIAQLQEEARKIDARGKRDSVLKAQNQATGSKNPRFLDMDFTMQEDTARQETIVPSTNTQGNTNEKVIRGANLEEPPVPVPQKQTAPDSITAVPVAPPPVVADSAEKKAVPEKTEVPPTAPPAAEVKKDMPAEKTPAPNPVPVTNTNCTAEASNEEVELITLLLKAEKNTDDALDVVRKLVRLKCVNTRQIRSMAAAFPEQEGKYRLLDMCYRFAADPQQYAVLANLLTDTYYLNRFKAMLQ